MDSTLEDILVVIPARGGSKGIQRKNSKLLCGKPLVKYTIESALSNFNRKHICLSTDDDEIANIGVDAGLDVPFLRPSELASDHASTQNVLKHALKFYEDYRNQIYTRILLLQPTSPFRLAAFFKQAIELFSTDCDMVASVHETKSNPYYVLFTESEGFLSKVSHGSFTRRQDCPIVYELNGNIYVINRDSLLTKSMSDFDKIRKFVIPDVYGVDLDNELDWAIAETIISQGLISSKETF